MEVEEEFSRCVIRLLYDEPFMGHLLAGVARHFGEATSTAAVGVSHGRIAMYVNPSFFLGLPTESNRVAVVKHEVLHLVFKHVDRIEDKDRRLWNLAADLVVNQFIGAWDLPSDAITLATFPDLGLAPDRMANEYYAQLAALQRELDAAGGDPDRTTARTSAKALASVGTWHSDHGRWTAADGDAGVTIDGWVTRTAARTGWGSLPGPLGALVAAALDRQRATVNWRRVLRIFGARSAHTRVASTLRRPSTRFGTFPGIAVKARSRLAVVVDTSGSIGDDDLAAFFAEIRSIWRTGADVTVVECDAAVQRTYAFRGETPTSVAGRGGTNPDPAFTWLRDGARWDGCVYLTDGEFGEVRVKPPCPLLWVVTNRGHEARLPFGRTLLLD